MSWFLTPLRLVQPPTLELYHPHVMASEVVAPLLRLVIDWSTPLAASKPSAYVSLWTRLVLAWLGAVLAAASLTASATSTSSSGGSACLAAVKVARPTGGSAIWRKRM